MNARRSHRRALELGAARPFLAGCMHRSGILEYMTLYPRAAPAAPEVMGWTTGSSCAEWKRVVFYCVCLTLRGIGLRCPWEAVF